MTRIYFNNINSKFTLFITSSGIVHSDYKHIIRNLNTIYALNYLQTIKSKVNCIRKAPVCLR